MSPSVNRGTASMNIVRAAVDKWSKSYGSVEEVVKDLLPFFSAVADSVGKKLGGEKRGTEELTFTLLDEGNAVRKRLRVSLDGKSPTEFDLSDPDLITLFNGLTVGDYGTKDVVMTLPSPSPPEVPSTRDDEGVEAASLLSELNIASPRESIRPSTPPTASPRTPPTGPRKEASTGNPRRSYSYENRNGKGILRLDMDALLEDFDSERTRRKEDAKYAGLAEAISEGLITTR